ncbi:hypothetical protein MKW94_002194 [Papaver nudicaule]|uniref:Cyclin N-terminal domain-containing protein n=1 Tax=Papaver nudicaule TaxID=74823 RepID=A0AA42B4T7_PAPNU|nr:hypothetical protein [Papaver nudicaule]
MMIKEAEKKITVSKALAPRKVITAKRGRRKVIRAKRHEPKASAIGLLKKKKYISEIDKDDVNNILAGVEYVEDLYKFYKLEEISSPIGDYMDQQTEIDVHRRLALVEWLIGVHPPKVKILVPSLVKGPIRDLFLAVHIVDRYLELNLVALKDLLLLGLSVMLIAGKYEEDYPPAVEEYVTISFGRYNREQILGMEKLILEDLGWSLTVPTTYHFLVRFIKAAGADNEMENLVFFMAEVGLMQYEITRYCPSMFAASAIYAAKLHLKMTPVWNETLEFHTGYSEPEVTECAQKLLSFHSEAVDHHRIAYWSYMSRARTMQLYYNQGI